ncbi:MAG: hypothetical protein ABSD57_04775 [Verrucomicrobiota bacterium]|jgi:hypothetical protein
MIYDLRVPIYAPAQIFIFSNTKTEVDRFVEVVKEIQKFFGQRFVAVTSRRHIGILTGFNQTAKCCPVPSGYAW